MLPFSGVALSIIGCSAQAPVAERDVRSRLTEVSATAMRVQ